MLNRFGQFSQKTLAVIGGTAVLVVIIIIGAVWLVRSRSEATRDTAAMALTETKLEQDLAVCADEKRPEVCQANLVEEAALKNQAVEICDKLDGTDFTTCVWKYAREQYEPDACESIDDKDKRQECSDSVYRALASRDVDISWCEKIKSDVVRTRCVDSLSEEIATTQGCAGTGIDQSVCDRLTALAAAAASEDPDQCTALENNEDQVSCLDSVGVGDRDHDGLDAALETSLGSSDTDTDSDDDGLTDVDEYRQHKTDPSDADSDNDGYDDKNEIENGYNPLGSGKL